MADNVIDSLKIEIQSSSGRTERSIERLAKTLYNLQNSVKGLNNIDINGFKDAMVSLRDSVSGFQDSENFRKNIAQIQRLSKINPGNMATVAAGLMDMGDAVRGLQGLVIPTLDDLNPLIANLRKFGGISFGNAKDYLPQISQSLVHFVEELNRVGSVQFDFSGVTTLVQNIAHLGGAKASEAVKNLPSLSKDLVDFINSLNGIKGVDFDLSGLAGLVSSISKLGGKSVANAIPNITNLADSLKQMMTTLSTAPKVSQNIIQMAQALAQLASAGGQAGTAGRGLVASFSSLPAATKKAKSGFAGLAGALGKFYATYWLLIRGMGQFKKAIDISSDLTEVQNVVDVTFGAMSDKMNEFSKSALQNYGMSELMAKQIGSRFQSMGVAMGFVQDKMSDMSVELTKLAGDMASFYNVSQEKVATALQSIFTGETEPMRRYGLDLSFATVETWALAQGIDADMQKMTQAEKTMLRYQYVLANSGAVLGDFSRTSSSFHNQIVLLSGAFQQLGSIVGGVLINAFKPFIQALNSVMGAVIQFAQTVSDALGAIFGWEFQTGGGVAQDLELGAGAAENIEDATGGAAKNAKEMSKYAAAWQEVNNMTTNDNSGGSGGSGGTGGISGTGAGSAGEWVQAPSLWEKYKSEIDSLYELGKYIGDALTSAMNNINWESVYESARNFGSGLADFLNGLISPELFGATGRTIAGALNTALHALDSFGETFNWKNFGDSIATGINSFFKKFDFKLLAKTLNTWANGILDTAISAVGGVRWDTIGRKIGEFIAEIDFAGILGKIGKLIWEAINAGISFWSGMFSAAPIETTILSVVAAMKISTITIQGIEAAGRAIDGIRLGLINLANAAVANPIFAVGTALGVLAIGLYNMEKNWKKEMADQYIEFMEKLSPSTEKLQQHNDELQKFSERTSQIEADAVIECGAIDTLKDKYFELAEKTSLTKDEQNLLIYYAEELIKKVPELAGAIDTTTGKYEGQKDELIKLIDAQKDYQMALAYGEILSEYNKELAQATINLKENNAERQNLVSKYSDLISTQNTAIEQGWGEYKLVEETGMTYKELAKEISFTEQAIKDNREANLNYRDTLNEVSEKIGLVEEELVKSKQAYEDTQEAIDNLSFEEMATDATNAVDEMHEVLSQDGVQILGQDAAAIYNEIQEGLNPDETGYYTLASEQLAQYKEGFTDGSAQAVSAMTDDLTKQIDEILTPQGKKAMFCSGLAMMEELTSGADSKKNDLKIAFEGYAAYSEEGFRKKLKELAKTSTPEVMRDWVFNGIMSPFTTPMGINSPSTVFAGYGKNTVEGFNKGLEENQGSTKGIIGTWVSNISDWFCDFIGIHSPSKVFSEFASYTVLGFNEGLENNIDSSYSMIKGWADGIANSFGYESLNLDLSVPKLDFSPKSYDIGKLQGTIQMELDTRMAEMEYENRQLRRSVDECVSLLESIYKKPALADDDIFNSARRGQQKFQRRTFRTGWAGVD